MRKRRRSSPARAAMKLLCLMLGLILTVMVGATAYFQYQTGLLPSLDLSSISVFSGDSWHLPELPSLNLGQFLSGTASNQIGGRGSNIVNILLVGQDRREGEERARSDSMILCTFNKKTKQLTMTSFLRDLYVPIPGYESNRINSAYAYGGIPLLEQTLQENFNLHIDGSVEVDFSQFAKVVDLLGGVEMELRQDEVEVINYETGSQLSAGTHRLTGDQALAYSRIRKLDADGDFSRTNRQRKVISALMDAYRGAGLTTMLTMTKNILPMITTDLSNVEILMYGLELFPMLSDAQIVSQYVPAAGTYSDQSINGMSVLVPDLEANQQILRETLLGN